NADIIVISDGGNNVGDLDAAIQEAVDAKVVVHTIAISQDADPRLETMSTITGGKNLVFLGDPDLGGTSLAAAMSSVVVSSVTSETTSPVTVSKIIL
ncbi:MAG: VWA domain-containing protein, partial [Sedimenticola sp.]